MSRADQRYSYDEIYRCFQKGWLNQPPERCPKCGNGAIEYLTENDDCAYAWCTWCHRKWLTDDECDPPGDYASGG